MTLSTLIVIFAIIGAILTAIVGYFFKAQKNWLVSFLQNFCGTWFIFSGFVKAVDPMGTAFKMHQYFSEFEATANGTLLSFLAPIFPWLANFAIQFSVFMIVLEIVLGVMLILGIKPKLTAWLFAIIMIFFTVLTGFTYLTGFVPTDTNFFDFGKWTAFKESNMRVTDCGCFGDFIKLNPKTSFFKDLGLMIPTILFLLWNKRFHQLFSPAVRNGLGWLTVAGFTYYCLSNFIWNEPQIDFRPFAIGANIREQKAAEHKAESEVRILKWVLKNKQNSKVVELSNDVYLKELANYSSEQWEIIDQIKTKPVIPHTKISDFEVQDMNGNDVTEDLLTNPNYSLMLVSYKLKDNGSRIEKITVQDSTFIIDTIRILGTDSFTINKTFQGLVAKTIEKEVFNWDKNYTAPYTETVQPVVNEAIKDGIQAFMLTALAEPQRVEDFRNTVNAQYPFYQGDDLLVKTIMRSNPGVVLLKNGEIINKWHYKQLPSYQEIKSKYMK